MPCPYHTLKILWTPVSTGVTTFYEIIKFKETHGRIENLPARGSDVGIEPFLGRLEDTLPFSLYATSDLG